MNEPLSMAFALISAFCSEQCFTAVFGGRSSGRFVQADGALVSRQLLLRMGVALVGFTCLCRPLAAAAVVSPRIRHGTPRSDAGDAPPEENQPRQSMEAAMHLSPDGNVFWQYGLFKLNATIVYTWGLMWFLPPVQNS